MQPETAGEVNLYFSVVAEEGVVIDSSVAEDHANFANTPEFSRDCSVSDDHRDLANTFESSVRSTAALPESPKVSPLAMSVNLINVSLGSGILSLPWAMSGASILVGIGLTLLVLLLNGLTNCVLVVAAQRTKAFDLGNLLGKLPGFWSRPARAFCDISIWVSVFFCLIGYLIVVTDSLEPFLPLLHIPAWCGRALSVSLGALLVLPLCFMDQSQLAIFSSISIAANLYLLVLIFGIFFAEDVHAAEQPCLLGQGRGTITMFTALMQAIIIQMCVLPMYEQLQNRSPHRFAACLAVGWGFVFILFVAFSAVSLLTYGYSVSSNVLLNLPDNIFGDSARLGMGFSMIGVYPLYLNSMIAPLRHSEARAARRRQVLALPSPPMSSIGSSPLSSPRVSPPGSMPTSPLLSATAPTKRFWPTRTWRSEGLWVKVMGYKAHFPAKPSHLATVIVVIASASGAYITHDLGTINVVNGALQVAGLVGAAPGLAGIFLVGRTSCIWRTSMFGIIIFGIVMSGVGFLYTDNFVDEMRSGCVWNVS